MSRAAARRSAGRPRAERRGFSLLELIVGLVLASILVTTLMGAITLVSRSVESGVTDGGVGADPAAVVDEITADLRLATSFSSRSASEVCFTVPDRSGDGLPETLRYEWSGPPLHQLSRQLNSGDPQILLEGVQHFSLEYLVREMQGVPPPSSGDLPPVVLFVVPDPAALDERDTERRTLIISWGYAVEMIAASAPQEDFDAAVATAAAAYVSEEIEAADLGTKLRLAPIGVVNEEGGLVDDFGLASSIEQVKDDEYVKILDGGHEITSGLIDPLGISDGKIRLNFARMTDLSPSAQVLVSKRDDTNLCCLAVLDAERTMVGGGLAPARRAQLPWGSDSDVRKLAAGGHELMRRTLEWVRGPEEEAPVGPAATFGYEAEFATPVSNVHRIQIATQATLAEGGTVTSLHAYVYGSGSDVRLALYTDAGGEPGTLVVESPNDNDPGVSWLTIDVDPTHVEAGTYWLALSFDSKSQEYFQEPGGETRYRSGRATKDGFVYNWGASSESYAVRMSMYATYTPD